MRQALKKLFPGWALIESKTQGYKLSLSHRDEEVTQTSNKINSHDVLKTKNSQREGSSLTNEKVVFA